MRPDGWWRIGSGLGSIRFFLHSNCGNSKLRQEKGETSSTANATWNDAGTEWIPELRWCDGWELSWGDGAQPRRLACARRPAPVSQILSPAGWCAWAERMLCERYTNSAALVSKQHECRYGRHSEAPFIKRCLSCLGQVVHPAHTR